MSVRPGESDDMVRQMYKDERKDQDRPEAMKELDHGCAPVCLMRSKAFDRINANSFSQRIRTSDKR